MKISKWQSLATPVIKIFKKFELQKNHKRQNYQKGQYAQRHEMGDKKIKSKVKKKITVYQEIDKKNCVYKFLKFTCLHFSQNEKGIFIYRLIPSLCLLQYKTSCWYTPCKR